MHFLRKQSIQFCLWSNNAEHVGISFKALSGLGHVFSFALSFKPLSSPGVFLLSVLVPVMDRKIFARKNAQF